MKKVRWGNVIQSLVTELYSHLNQETKINGFNSCLDQLKLHYEITVIWIFMSHFYPKWRSKAVYNIISPSFIPRTGGFRAYFGMIEHDY